jgi:glycosyltransferase involved in cell wall biosynthesis
MKKIEVTIGVCVRNCESTIEESLSSVLNQDYPHEMLRIVVVDGNSEDRTIPIAKDLLSRTDIKFRILSDNGEGLGKARSIVVDNASGKYIVWVDGDVVLPRNHVSEQIEFMEKNIEVGIVGSRFLPNKGKSLCALLENLGRINLPYTETKKTRYTATVLPTAASTVRLCALKQVGSFDKEIRGAGEDFDIALRIKSAGWLLSKNQEVLHICRERWKHLWDEQFWYGYGGHYISHKFPGSVALCTFIFPPFAFAYGIREAFRAYDMTHLKASFLLPLYYVFIGMAWLSGYAKSHIDGYDPRHLGKA